MSEQQTTPVGTDKAICDSKVPIAKFIKELTSGDYAKANSHLQTAINNKIKSRISTVKDINIF
jgi:hypothetical protein